MRLMVLGDVHGNTPFVTDYIFPVAKHLYADAIVQCGDFGYWEHHPSGIRYLNALEDVVSEYDIPLYWLHGNHDKHSLTLRKYADRRTAEGFIVCRDGVNYIPQGHVWQWRGKRMRVFGGAYSLDKDHRLLVEESTGMPESSWFPEEEMTDAEMDGMLADDSGKLDIVFSHDMPYEASPLKNDMFRRFPETIPNQLRLQRALAAHRPRFWFHGHLHHPYTDVLDPGNGVATTVVGLGCDSMAAPRFVKPHHAWAIVDLSDGDIEVTPAWQREEWIDLPYAG